MSHNSCCLDWNHSVLNPLSVLDDPKFTVHLNLPSLEAALTLVFLNSIQLSTIPQSLKLYDKVIFSSMCLLKVDILFFFNLISNQLFSIPSPSFFLLSLTTVSSSKLIYLMHMWDQAKAILRTWLQLCNCDEPLLSGHCTNKESIVDTKTKWRMDLFCHQGFSLFSPSDEWQCVFRVLWLVLLCLVLLSLLKAVFGQISFRSKTYSFSVCLGWTGFLNLTQICLLFWQKNPRCALLATSLASSWMVHFFFYFSEQTHQCYFTFPLSFSVPEV